MEDKAKGLIIAKEIKEYAGQKIEVTRTIQAGSEQEKAFRAEMAANKKKSNLENILNSLQAKNNMNTLDKTRVDWGVSKEIEGDQQALTQSTKDGYLEKQNFLQRTEDIAYMKKKEIEKKKRSEKHAIEAMKEAKKGAL